MHAKINKCIEKIIDKIHYYLFTEKEDIGIKDMKEILSMISKCLEMLNAMNIQAEKSDVKLLSCETFSKEDLIFINNAEL
jgi:hypothetical protein